MVDAVLSENFSGLTIFLIRDGEQQMLCRDVLVLHRLRAFFSSDENLAQTRAEILLPALNLGKARDSRLHIIENDLHVRAEFAENGADNAFGLFEHGEQDVLRLDFLMLVALGHFDGRLNGLLAAQCEFI